MRKDYKISILLDCYGGLLTDKQFDMLNHYYNEDLSLSEIAENEGISRQGVYDAVKRAEEQLLLFEDKIGYLKICTEYENIISDIKQYACDASSGKCDVAEALEKIISKTDKI